MPQAIKHYNGVTDGSSGNLATSTIYTCPANTISIVLPNMLFVTTYYGGAGGVGYNSSTVSNCYDKGNFSFFGGSVGYPWQITHSDKHSVRVGLMPHSVNGYVHYSPNFTSYIRSDYYAMSETEDYANSTAPIRAAVVGGQMYRGNSQNYTAVPNDMYVGSWVMGAGDKLTVTAITMRVQWDFLILEEAA